jgi:hypothetical protein
LKIETIRKENTFTLINIEEAPYVEEARERLESKEARELDALL